MNRREFLKTSGVLVIGFSLFNTFSPDTSLAQGGNALPASLMRHPEIDAWLQIHADGTVTVFTGKIELGQGIKTALMQMAAEELEVNFERMRIVQADTGRTPDEGLTAGSRSVEQSGMAIRSAAAEARALLMALAAEELGEPTERLQVEDGVVGSENRMETTVTYWTLIGGRRFESKATGTARLKNPADYRIVGQPVRRNDIPAIVSGAPL